MSHVPSVIQNSSVRSMTDCKARPVEKGLRAHKYTRQPAGRQIHPLPTRSAQDAGSASTRLEHSRRLSCLSLACLVGWILPPSHAWLDVALVL